MIETGMCDYRTPCGWCSKWDKKCDKKIGPATQINTNQFNENDMAITKADIFTKFCRDCPSGTGDVTSLSSHPIRCSITGRCHTINDTCDIERNELVIKYQESIQGAVATEALTSALESASPLTNKV